MLIAETVVRMLDPIKDSRFVPLRLPRDLYAEVEARAATMGRTVAMETVELVRAGLAENRRRASRHHCPTRHPDPESR